MVRSVLDTFIAKARKLWRTRASSNIPAASRGFSFIELIVVIAILVIIASLVLVDSARSRSELQVTNMAYDIALILREAQQYGISVRGAEPGTFSAGYGVFLEKTENTEIILFADTNGTQGEYDAGEDTLLKMYTLRNGYTIQRFCIWNGSSHCSNNASNLQTLNVVFRRPSTDANIVTDPAQTNITSATIYLRSPWGSLRPIRVLLTGQIEVL